MRKSAAKRCFLREDEKLDKLKTMINKISAIGWAVCGPQQPDPESMMPLLSFSLLSV